MLTLYHAPHSRSTRIVQPAVELGIIEQIEVRIVSIPRQDGSGGADPANPHPDKKVPVLVHDGEMIWESPAIIVYLTDMFPESGFAPLPGEQGRGTYLSWLAYYGDVIEPALIFQMAGLKHPLLDVTFPDDARSRPADRGGAGPSRVAAGRPAVRRRPARRLALPLVP